ncbi:MAG TPA: hypothetical protein VFH94_00010 [Streptomyces sp.]|nr:hypothetical protein [Streptomyces sp.]
MDPTGRMPSGGATAVGDDGWLGAADGAAALGAGALASTLAATDAEGRAAEAAMLGEGDAAGSPSFPVMMRNSTMSSTTSRTTPMTVAHGGGDSGAVSRIGGCG